MFFCVGTGIIFHCMPLLVDILSDQVVGGFILALPKMLNVTCKSVVQLGGMVLKATAYYCTMVC